jgi:hypothetical protein
MLATEELRLAGAGSPQVTRRLEAALTDLRSIAPPERVDVIDQQLERLATAVDAVMDEKSDAAFALTADRKGIGAAST